MKGRKGGQGGCGSGKLRNKAECWIEQGRCILPIKVDCWHHSDCHHVEVNLATLNFFGMPTGLRHWSSLIRVICHRFSL